MAAHQFRDLPMIPQSLDESSYHGWGSEHNGYMYPYKQYSTSFDSEEYLYFQDYDNGMVSTMERFMLDQYPLTQGVLHAKIPIQRELDMRYEEQWPSADCFRNVSPDRTSASGNSSHATPNELRSPHTQYAGPYEGFTDVFSQLSSPYPATEHCNDGGLRANTPLLGGSISLRELEYEQLEPESAMEDIDNIDLKEETVCDHEHAVVVVAKSDSTSENYKQYADSGIGNSVRDAESVQPIELQEDPASDSDYSPSSSRSGKRRRSSTSNSSASKVSKRRGSARKDSQVSSPTNSNKTPRRHRGASIATKTYVEVSDDRRPFPCPLAAYGCASTFSSKNEWKRHVSTQHIKLGFWRCDLCLPTTDPNDDQTSYYNDFNRKDLFTQHLRRMHAASKSNISQNQKEFPVNEDNLPEHQTRCLKSLRKPPQQSGCLFCDKMFDGSSSWEERMEHIGRHLEKDRKSSVDVLDVKGWNVDKGLEKYLLEEGLVVKEQGEWKIGDGKPKRGVVGKDDVDSEEE